MTYDPDKARKAVRDPRWSRRCSLMGCTTPSAAHDHHMFRGHLDYRACFCREQSGEPGSFGPEGSTD